MTEEKYQELVNKIKDFLNTLPSFNYKGRGMNDGIWEMDDMIDLDHCPNGNSTNGKFRVIIYHDSLGVQATIEFYPISVYEWVDVFVGHIPSFEFFKILIEESFGIKKIN